MNRLKSWVIENKNALIIGFIFLIISKNFDYIRDGILNLAEWYFTRYVNEFYKLVATNNDGELITFIAFVITIGFLSGLFMIGSYLSMKIEISRLDQVGYLKRLIDKKMGTEETSVPIRKLKDQLKEIESRLKNKRKDYIYPVVTVLMGLLLFNKMIKHSVVMDLNVKFRNKITILTPYLKESEINMYKSQWASMENSIDYHYIMDSLNHLEVVYLKDKK